MGIRFARGSASGRSEIPARRRAPGSISRYAIGAGPRIPSSGCASGAEETSMKKAFVIGSLLLVLTLSLGGTVASKGTDNSSTYEQLRLFTEVLSIVQNQYVDEVPPKELIYSAIKGTLRGLDPHSSFLDPESYREMQVETSGSFGGLGIEITIRDDQLTVVAPIESTPAWRAGIQPGDRILKIEGLATKDMSLPDAVKKMRGPKGTKVTITVTREGTREPFDVS